MTVTYIMNTFLFVIPVIAVLYVTFHDKLRRPFFLSLLGAVCIYICASYLGSMVAMHYIPTRINRTLISTISVVCGALIFYAAMQYRFSQSLFITTIIKCFVDDVSLTASALHLLIRGFLPASFADFPAWPVCITILVTFPLIFQFYKRLLRPTLDDTASYSFWNYMWIVPFCSNALYSLCVGPLFSEVVTKPTENHYLVPILWIIFSFTTFFLQIRIVQETAQNISLHSTLHVTDIQMATQKKQIETLQRNAQRNRRARHDIRHHILALQTMLTRKEYAQALDYLQEYDQKLEANTSVNYTAHTVLNTILTHYFDLCKKNDIRTNVSLSLDETLPVSDMDLCIILGNLLENAVEACCRQTGGDRFLSLQMTMKSPDILVLIIENSYNGIIREQNDSFLSSKEDGRIGIGIDSVRHLVKQYHGVCKIAYNTTTFKVNILLNKA